MSTYKIVICGGDAVGKTNLVYAWHGLNHPKTYSPTQGFQLSTWTSPQGNTYKLWDIGGRYMGMTNYLTRTNAFLFVYDSDIPNSIDQAHKWETTARRLCGNVTGIYIDTRDIRLGTKSIQDIQSILASQL